MARSVENSRGESWTADRDPSPSHLSQYISKETPLSLCVYFHVCLENAELKPTMKWDVGGIDFFFMPALTGQKIHEYGDLTFALFSPVLDNKPRRRAATQDDSIWLRLWKLLLPSKRHRFLWRSNTQTNSDGLSEIPRLDSCHLHQTLRRDLK